MSQGLTIILFVIFTAGVVGASVWLVSWMGRRMRAGAVDASRAAAVKFGLEAEDDDYKGTVDGVLVTVRAASRTIVSGSPNKYGLRFTPVTVTASLPTAETAASRDVFDAHLKGSASVIDAIHEVIVEVKAAATSPPPRWLEVASARAKEKLSRFKELRITNAGPIAAGISLKDAHHFPRDENISTYETPPGFPRRSPDEKTPDGLSRLEVECDTGTWRDTRNQWYSYSGRFLSLLVRIENGEIWDARWESADY